VKQNDNMLADAISALVPRRSHVTPDWDDVISRLGDKQPRALRSEPNSTPHSGHGLGARPIGRRRPRPKEKRLIVAAIALIAVLCSSALAVAGRQWWFAGSGAPPPPASDVRVVTEGTWEGTDWSLAVYRSTSGEVCYAITPYSSDSGAAFGGALSCFPTSSTTGGTLAQAGQPGFPPFIAGAVIEAAVRVRFELSDGSAVEAETFSASKNLAPGFRFYSVALPCHVEVDRGQAIAADDTIVGEIMLPPEPSREAMGGCPGDNR
jgi:hypothetical protein